MIKVIPNKEWMLVEKVNADDDRKDSLIVTSALKTPLVHARIIRLAEETEHPPEWIGKRVVYHENVGMQVVENDNILILMKEESIVAFVEEVGEKTGLKLVEE
jgi:co-chaperonin GroES (HSP10)